MALYLPEIQAKLFLPLVRKEFAIQLSERGFKQQEIAEVLSSTQAAISHYLNERRGKRVLPQEIKERISTFLEENKKPNPKEIANFVMKLCEDALHSRVLCRLHQDHENTPDGCDVCFK